MQLKFIKFILKLLSVRPKLHHVVILFAPLLVFFRFNHLIEQADLAVSPTLTIGKVAYAETQEKAEEKETPAPQTPSKSAATATEEATKILREGFDPLTLDENQIKVLQAMAEAQAKKDNDAEAKRQEELIKLSKEEINEKINELQKLNADMKNRRGSLSKEEQANIIQTAKIYENMKPAAAAEIFNKLEMIVLVQLVKHMDRKKASPIMAAMDPKKARALTIELLRAGPVVAP